MTFSGKVVLVTGAAGGLGLEISKGFLSQGAKVVMVDINAGRLNAAISSLTVPEDTAYPIATDITGEENVKHIFFGAIEKFGQVDILVNNAGIADRFDPVGTCEIELWDRVMAVNLTAPMLLSKHAVDHFLGRDPAGGVILNVGSIGGERGLRAGVAYTASKHGVIGLTKNTAAFYSKKNVRCNAVLPGAMKTNISDSFANGHNEEGMGFIQLTMAMNPTFVDLDKVAEAVMFLCSPGAGGITGACVEVDNGWTAW